MRRRVCSGFTLVELLVVLAVIAVLLGLIVAGVQGVRASAQRTICANNLKPIGLALHQYHEVHKRFPPGVSVQNGNEQYLYMAWCARLLPYLDQQALWVATEKAYKQEKQFFVNPPHVGFVTVLPVFSCPSDPRTLDVGKYLGDKDVAFLSYLGVQGLRRLRPTGVLYRDSRIRIADITDGTSSTLAVGERPPSADGLFGWWYGGTGPDGGGTADSVLGVRELNMAGPTGWCPTGPFHFGPGRLDNQCDMYHFWSPHSGGGHFLFCDGSARFLAYSADAVMPGLASRAGREHVSIPD